MTPGERKIELKLQELERRVNRLSQFGVQPVGIPGAWTLAFADEFNGPAGPLDPASWTAIPANRNGTDMRLDGSGHLILTLPGRFSSDELDCVPHLLAVGDCAEARIWMPGSAADVLYNHATFWASGPSWPAAGEIDICESAGWAGGNGQLMINYHCPTSNPGYAPAGSWANSWHTYAVHRNASTDDVYWDGVKVQTVPTADNGLPETIRLTLTAEHPGGGTTNFLTGQNATFDGGIGTWGNDAGAGATSPYNDTAHHRSGSGSLGMYITAAGNAYCTHAAGGDTADMMPVQPGDSVTASAWFLAASVARSVRVAIIFLDANGSWISGVYPGGSADNTSTWTQQTNSATAPAGAVYARAEAWVLAAGGAGEVHYCDDVTLIDVTSPGANEVFGSGGNVLYDYVRTWTPA